MADGDTQKPQRDKPWLFRTNLARGQTGYDSDYLLAAGDVGPAWLSGGNLRQREWKNFTTIKGK
jgi:hypothetical protein